MKAVNLENVQEAGTFNRLPAGGYVCRYTKVEDVADKDYLYMEYDIAEGEFKDYYKQLFEAKDFWGGRVYRSYKENALPMFKRMCSALSKSNPGYVFDGGKINANEKTIEGKWIGLVFGEEEYVGNDGNTKTRLYVYSECGISDIRNGNFKVPEIKKLENAPANTSGGQAANTYAGFYNTEDDNVPFN